MTTHMQDAKKRLRLRDAMNSIARINSLIEKLDAQIKARRLKQSA